MKRHSPFKRQNSVILLLFFLFSAASLRGQGTLEDYKRADRLRTTLGRLVYHTVTGQAWIEKSHRFWYSRQTAEGKEFLLVDAEKKNRNPAFDHGKLAEQMAAASGQKVSPEALPFSRIQYVNQEKEIHFTALGFQWIWDRKTQRLKKGNAATESQGMRRRVGRLSPDTLSPDGLWLAFVREHNVFIRSTKNGQEYQLSFDGTEDCSYAVRDIWSNEQALTSRFIWSPDSKKFIAFHTQKGDDKKVYLIESTPADQLRPKMQERIYPLPGDRLPVRRPVIFFVNNRRPIKLDNTLFSKPYEVTGFLWFNDSSSFTFRYHERGEQRARVFRVNAATGRVHMVLEETSNTFIDRWNLRNWNLEETKEFIWTSERDGWRHYYLYDTETGTLKNQITKGSWVVRGIDHIDEKNRQLYFRASGREEGQDPYFIHFYRINLDGTGLFPLTHGNATHSVSYSSDFRYYTDTSSRIDSPPVTELRRVSDGGLLMTLEEADISKVLETGWKLPETFTAKGRDGRTDIWGLIYRPSRFDPAKKYPVIEYIYAGPHSSYVPKTFAVNRSAQALTELGFIVVRMDGMGTANRSKAFHDVAWKNVGDAGFPDRIAWIKAAAARYPFMDLSRVGIYGTSAGGQNSLGALLFHPDFYHVAVSASGCHDNRMDKASWNEAWMGYPVGPHYAEQSNATNAHKLQGKLLLILGELDTNVPPQSTLQVIDALIEANKDFDFLFIPGAGHTSGGVYGERKRRDFFVKHLLGVEPPDWNLAEEKGK